MWIPGGNALMIEGRIWENSYCGKWEKFSHFLGRMRIAVGFRKENKWENDCRELERN